MIPHTAACRASVPLSLALEQAPALATLGRIAIRSVLPAGLSRHNPGSFTPVSVVVPAPADRLVSCYAEWSGAGDRYIEVLPPHLFSHWALPAAARVLEQTRYNLASIVNLGMAMRINAPLPRGTPLHLTAQITSLKESRLWARVSVQVASGTAQRPDAVIATLQFLFILADGEREGTRSTMQQPQWSTAGCWSAARDDGFRFALLTGDFNPIHWSGLAGRLSPFRRTVLQGMGMLACSFECLADAGPIAEINVRFLKPVVLPSAELRVQHSAPDGAGWRALRLAGDAECTHMAGRYRRHG